MKPSFNPKKIFDVLKATFKEWSDDNCLRLSAALAYYSIFSIAPLIVIAIGIAGWVLGSSQEANDSLRSEIAKQMGPQAAEGVMGMVKGAAGKPETGVWATVVGFGVLLFGASTVFGQLKDALNVIWGVKAKPGAGAWGFIRERLLSFGMVLVIGFLLLTSLLMSTALAGFSGMLEKAMPLPAFVWGVLGFFLSFGVVTLLFALIFKVLPDAKVEWRTVWVGAAFTALLFELGKWGLGMYLGRESTQSSYGAAGSLVLLLLWVYWTSVIIFFGAEFTQVYAKVKGHAIQPADYAERVTAEERAKQGLEPHPGEPTLVASRVPAEPSVLADEKYALALPKKETLVPLMVPDVAPVPVAVVWGPPPGPVREKVNEWVETANRHPFAELGAALGIGLVVGLLSRAMGERQEREIGATEHFRLGTEAAAAAGVTALAGFGSWLRPRVRSGAKSAWSAADAARRQLAEIGEEVPRRVKKAMR